MIEDYYTNGYKDIKLTVRKFNDTVVCQSRWGRSRTWLLDELAHGMKVLDYGCCVGTLGGLGKVAYKGKTFDVEGFDIDTKNELAKYHTLEEITGRYDAIILSHVVEHCEPAVVHGILDWCSQHSDKLYIVTPNAGLNPFVDFWCDIGHVRPYNTGAFLYWLHQYGYELRVVWTTLPKGGMINKLYGIFDAKLRGTSPFQEYCVACTRNGR